MLSDRKLLVVKNRGGNALAMIPVDCHPNFSFREQAERDLHSLQPLQKLHCAVKVGMSVIFQPGVVHVTVQVCSIVRIALVHKLCMMRDIHIFTLSPPPLNPFKLLNSGLL